MRYVKRAVLVCGAAVLLCWLFSVAAYATGSLPDAVQRRNAGRLAQGRAGAAPERSEM